MWRPEGVREALTAGLLAVALVPGVFIVGPASLGFSVREAVFDQFTKLFPRTGPEGDVVIVDIDSATLERLGPWPWRRAQIARLTGAISKMEPKVIALDILLEGADHNGPRSIIARLAESEGRSDLRPVAESFADDDASLAAAIDGKTPVVIGLGLGGPSRATYPALVLARASQTPPRFSPVRIPGVTGPPPALVDAAAGLGILSLDADQDGMFRRFGLLFAAGEGSAARLHAGFAMETLRIVQGANAIFIGADSRSLEIGALRLRVEDDTRMRLYPRATEYWRDRIIPAWRLFEPGALPIGATTIVVVGSSAPEAGVYLPGAVSGPVAALRVQAEAIDQLRGGAVLRRAPFAPWSEWIGALIAGLLGVFAAVVLTPARAAGVTLSLALACMAVSFLLFQNAMVLADAAPAVIAAVCGAIAASATIHSRIRANRALVEARFARYLAPAVVEILARNPQLLRIEAERREVTALFTDLEGFTAFGERTPPADLIATLNDYFELIAHIAVEHGGMVDKIVGDAVHVFFNMPLDQPDHAERAVRCARAIRTQTEEYRRMPRQAALGLGRTRIGVDTGFATVGDVGGRDKLDYTAHGEAVNRAARLQSLAREFESGVLIGEGTVRRLPDMYGLKSVGSAIPRGLSVTHELFTFV